MPALAADKMVGRRIANPQFLIVCFSNSPLYQHSQRFWYKASLLILALHSYFLFIFGLAAAIHHAIDAKIPCSNGKTMTTESWGLRRSLRLGPTGVGMFPPNCMTVNVWTWRRAAKAISWSCMTLRMLTQVVKELVYSLTSSTFHVYALWNSHAVSACTWCLANPVLY